MKTQRLSNYILQGLVGALLLGWLSTGMAMLPQSISYQGHLSDLSGTPVDTTTNITFRLYNVDVGGVPDWQDTLSVVVNKGLFSVELGAGVPFPLNLFDGPLWLGIEVGSDGEMAPRKPLTSVGFAFRAEDAQTLEGISASSLDQSAHVANLNNPHGVTAASIGALSGTELTTHAGDSSAHHARYADSEAVSAIKAADGAGSGLDADLLDGSDSTAFGSAAQVAANQSVISANASAIASLQAQIATLQASNAALVDLLQHFSRSGDNVIITGANLHIRSGLGSTNGWNGSQTTVNGLGNLVVGYDESRPGNTPFSCSLGEYTTSNDCTSNGGVWAENHKGGSHNIVLGSNHNYSRYAGFVAGFNNTISGRVATVTGGIANTASGLLASVSGGQGNRASGIQASVSGGWKNTASGENSSASGGQSNTASGYTGSVSGGANNTASGLAAWVGSGEFNQAIGVVSSIAGGGGPAAPDGNLAVADHSAILGGLNNLTGDGSCSSSTPCVAGTDSSIARAATVSGGTRNHAGGAESSLGGGFANQATGLRSSVNGGEQNLAVANYSSILGGMHNLAGDGNCVSGSCTPGADATVGRRSTISGGTNNQTNGIEASVSGGFLNTASGLRASVSGGQGNTASGSNASSVSGGWGNTASGDMASVSGGRSNAASGLASAVSGGRSNNASGDYATVSGGGGTAVINGSVVTGNHATGNYSTVSGGVGRNVSGSFDWRAGNLFESN